MYIWSYFVVYQSNKDTIKKAFAESLPNNVELVVGYDVKPLSGHVYIVGTAIMSKIKKI